jgi:signal transduction histidine kinase
VARRIVEAHGGKLDLESVAGKGTRYLIELPIYR